MTSEVKLHIMKNVRYYFRQLYIVQKYNLSIIKNVSSSTSYSVFTSLRLSLLELKHIHL